MKSLFQISFLGYLLSALLIITLPLSAQDNICLFQDAGGPCLKFLKQQLLEQNNKFDENLSKAISKNGISILFTSLDPQGGTLIQQLPFAGKMNLFKYYLSKTEFFENIPNNKNLYDYFLSFYQIPNITKFNSLDEINLLFMLIGPETPDFMFHDWENKDYPANYTKHFTQYLNAVINSKEKFVTNEVKTKAKAVIIKLKDLDTFAKNICKIKSVEDYQQSQEIYGDFHKFHSSKGSFLSCVLENNNTDLLEFMLMSENFQFSEYKEIISKFINHHSADSKEILNKTFEKVIQLGFTEELFMMGMLRPYHLFVKDFQSCLQLNLKNTQKNKTELIAQCDESLFSEISERVELAKADYLKHGILWSKHLDEISEIYLGGFNYDYGDENHNTIIHLMVDQNIRDMVIYLEQKLNTKKKLLSYFKRNKEGMTPLLIAIKNNNLQLIKDYTLSDKKRDHARFPFAKYSEIKKIKNIYGEKMDSLINRLPASTKEQRIFRDGIVEQVK